jgi:tripartite-type tricarboxylate transporter receptor subunit TctC
MLRKVAIAFCLVLLGLAAGPQQIALAQNWPQRPVRLIVPFAAGGGTDIVARVLAQRLGETLGQSFVVENKPGASGMIGAELVAKGDADGYTLLVASPAEIALNQHLYPSIAYDPLRDFAPITLLAWTPMVFAAHPSFSASTVAQLVDLARARPIQCSSPGIGSAHHLVLEYINTLAGTHFEHIPYRGASPAVQDAVAGQVKLTISGMPPVVPFLQAGALKAIGVTSRDRLPIFPNIPAMAENEGFEHFDFTNWFGLLARSGTPQPILDRLSEAAVKALQIATVRDTLKAQAAEPVGNSPVEFGRFIAAESAKYRRIVEVTGVKLK